MGGRVSSLSRINLVPRPSFSFYIAWVNKLFVACKTLYIVPVCTTTCALYVGSDRLHKKSYELIQNEFDNTLEQAKTESTIYSCSLIGQLLSSKGTI